MILAVVFLLGTQVAVYKPFHILNLSYINPNTNLPQRIEMLKSPNAKDCGWKIRITTSIKEIDGRPTSRRVSHSGVSYQFQVCEFDMFAVNFQPLVFTRENDYGWSVCNLLFQYSGHDSA